MGETGKIKKTRGFITIATGDKHYYKLAVNLLHSYRMFAKEKIPFCLLCDSENEYAKEFDDVVILKNAHRSYLDKLQIYYNTPYEETIFIDADSLAYSDLNKWWSFFSNQSDFSAFGIQRDLYSGEGFFDPEQVGEYRKYIKNIPDFTAGVYYLRKTQICESVFNLANEFAKHYHEYGFKRFVYSPADEPVLALAMAVHQCVCTNNIYDSKNGWEHICLMPRHKYLDADIVNSFARYKKGDQYYSAELIHWGNRKTKRYYYRFEVERMDRHLGLTKFNRFKKLLHKDFIRFRVLQIEDLRLLPDRIKYEIKNMQRKADRQTSKT